MATKPPTYTWENGFRQVTSKKAPWDSPRSRRQDEEKDGEDGDAYVTPPEVELVSSASHNSLGINVIRNWPTIYNGTNSPHGLPLWWHPQSEVDVLICGAGPSGLEVAVSLARQGVSFRIIDAADTPLIAGRADGVQPRFLETVSQWGLSTEIHEEGPLIERTAIYKDGKKLFFNRSHQSDSRYRGLHIITQGQIERIFIRDLLRHKALVERSSVISSFGVDDDASHPVRATVRNKRTGREEAIKAKFLVGSDGAASSIRKKLDIPFDGVSTDIYWGIMDCVLESDYPHAWVFGSVISSKHGGCVIIPREDGYIRLYTQLDVSHTGSISQSRQARDLAFAEAGGRVEAHSITPNEVLEQANRIFAPYKLKFAAPLSCHVHSVMGAFGLNASILDAANLAWKLGLVARGNASLEPLLATYNNERRKHAVRIIEVSGKYLRFVCGSSLAIPDLTDMAALEKGQHDTEEVNDLAPTTVDANHMETSADKSHPAESGVSEGSQFEDLEFLSGFYKAHGQFLLGVDCPYDPSVLTPVAEPSRRQQPAIRVKNGVRAPNPRICFSQARTGYLYDQLAGPPCFHLIIFGSSLVGVEVCRQVTSFFTSLAKKKSFYNRFKESDMLKLVLVVKMSPFEWDATTHLRQLYIKGTMPSGVSVVFDDRAPDEDAHTAWGVNHTTGGVAIVRPDLWVSLTAFPDEVERFSAFFDAFLKED
ncbi:Phenol 2-monooxygenase [Tolypocladium ophioglossoides CBS 100239]|uniref:Phenol 2-monooxygenase n=1 Tax=Tolypocladium ophioglossoides (strain CBS 100239) TaxID=1163406 RepID=A0A0L0N4W1_TOLOC|nr:Phenol 2-monooxygenase [Tolypocladium ophioglossoides CBS 100239]